MTEVCTCGDSPRPTQLALEEEQRDREVRLKSVEAKLRGIKVYFSKSD